MAVRIAADQEIAWHRIAADQERIAASDEEDEESVPEKRLRFVDLLTEVPNGDATAAKELLLQNRGLTVVDSLESVKSLKKLELGGNYIKDLHFLEMNHELCWLGLAKNRLRCVSHLQALSSLAVLDLSDNRIERLDGLEGLTGLKALILARNQISRITGLSAKTHSKLETLVLSHNRISECSLSKFKCLQKLSLGNNRLRAFPTLSQLPALAELRLNSNKITVLPDSVATMPKLSILDVGNNLLTELSALEPLRGLLWLKSLSLLGNDVAKDMEAAPVATLLGTLQSLEIVNNKRCAGAGTSKKMQKRNRQWGAKDASVAPVAINGREFEGKRAVFKDSDDEGTTAKGSAGSSHKSTGGAAWGSGYSSGHGYDSKSSGWANQSNNDKWGKKDQGSWKANPKQHKTHPSGQKTLKSPDEHTKQAVKKKKKAERRRARQSVEERVSEGTSRQSKDTRIAATSSTKQSEGHASGKALSAKKRASCQSVAAVEDSLGMQSKLKKKRKQPVASKPDSSADRATPPPKKKKKKASVN